MKENRKKLMIKALEQSLGIASVACKQVGINRETHYRWLKTDEKYKKQVEKVTEIVLDFTEAALFNRVKAGDTTAILFVLRNKGRERGYEEKQLIEHSGEVSFTNLVYDYTHKRTESGKNAGGNESVKQASE